MDLALILTIIGILVSVLIPLLGYLFKTKRTLKNYYSVIWKKSSSLKHKDVLGERPYNSYYFERKEDPAIKRQLERRNNILLIGPPLMGKSRSIFEQLLALKKSVDVLIPRAVQMPHFLFPKDFKFWRKKIIFIDDLQYYVEKQDNYHMLFRTAKEKNIIIAATCHSGQDFKKVKNKMIEQSIDIDHIFGDNIIEYEKISPETGKQIAEKLRMNWDKAKFNGTIGSIFMRLSEMERRFDGCTDIEKAILVSIRMMYITGLYSDNGIFITDWLKLTAGSRELTGKDFEWSGWLKSLEGKEFVKIIRRDKLWAEEAYLQYVVKEEVTASDIDIFNEMIEIFKNEPAALVMIGRRAYDTGSVDIDIADYSKAAIRSLELALGKLNKDDAHSRARALELIGTALWGLAKIEDVETLNKKALGYYSEAQKLIDKNNNPLDYSRLISKIAASYTAIAGVHDKELNCNMAITLYSEAMEFFTFSSYPVEYAQNCNNVGAVYQLLAQVKDPVKNLKLAAEFLKKSISVRTREQYPREFGFSNNNLGNTYSLLSDYEDKAANLKKAVECYTNFLDVSPKEKDIIAYGYALASLGICYSWLAEVQDTELNIRKAIEILNKALEVRNRDRFPVHYSIVQYHLGSAYLALAKFNKDSEACYKALDAYEESLAIRTVEKYPEYFALNQVGLGDIYIILAEKEDKSENYSKSLAAYDQALRVYSQDAYPNEFAAVQDKITIAKKIFF